MEPILLLIQALECVNVRALGLPTEVKMDLRIALLILNYYEIEDDNHKRSRGLFGIGINGNVQVEPIKEKFFRDKYAVLSCSIKFASPFFRPPQACFAPTPMNSF